jgi:hypothetical protein
LLNAIHEVNDIGRAAGGRLKPEDADGVLTLAFLRLRHENTTTLFAQNKAVVFQGEESARNCAWRYAKLRAKFSKCGKSIARRQLAAHYAAAQAFHQEREFAGSTCAERP